MIGSRARPMNATVGCSRVATAVVGAGALVVAAATVVAAIGDDWWPLAVVAVALAAAGATIGAVCSDDVDRSARRLLAAGLVSWAAAEVIALVQPGYEEAAATGLTAADPLYLATYPCFVAGLVLAARHARDHRYPGFAFDVAIALAAVVTVAVTLTGPVVDLALATPGRAATVVALVYPIADLAVLLTVVVAAATVGWRCSPALVLIAVATTTYAAGDLAYLVRVATSGDVSLHPADFTWPYSAVVLAAGALAPFRATRPARQEASVRSLVVALLGTVTALAALVASALHAAVPLLAVACAAVTVLLSVARTSLAYRRLGELASSRAEARTDELTGLANRRAFREALAARLELAARQPVSLVLVDLDGFKEVNDTLGHEAGDQLLVVLAGRFTSIVPRGALLCRLGGDEFAVVVDGDLPDAEAFAERLCETVRRPVELGGTRVRLDASVGVASAPAHGTDPSELTRLADAAMYRAKRAGGGVTAHRPDDTRPDPGHLQRVATVRASVEQGAVVVHYQPKVALVDGAVVGVEALARLAGDEPGRLLLPAEFLPLVAPSRQLSACLTGHVLAASLAALRAWHDAGLDLHLAVNVGAHELCDPGFAPRVVDALDRHDVRPDRVVVEVTEESMDHDAPAARRTVEALRACGVRVALDDFGRGSSNLARLESLPVDELKIDRSLVEAIHRRSRSESIVRAVVDLAHALGVVVVAEGVEHPEELEVLADAGVDVVQGHVTAPALVAEDVTTLALAAQNNVARLAAS